MACIRLVDTIYTFWIYNHLTFAQINMGLNEKHTNTVVAIQNGPAPWLQDQL